MKKGFTLVELLIVVIIIGILATIAMPQYQRFVERSRAAEANTILGAIRNAEEVYKIDNAKYLVVTDAGDIATGPSANNKKLMSILPVKDSTEHYFKYTVLISPNGLKFLAIAERKQSPADDNKGKTPNLTSTDTKYYVTVTEKGVLDSYVTTTPVALAD